MTVAVLADEPPYGSEKKYDGFFHYVNVPGPYEYELGFKRGNQGHFVSRFEQFKDARFRTKVKPFRLNFTFGWNQLRCGCYQVKWGDEEGSYGEQIWEFNHAPAAPAYPSAPAYPESDYPAPPSYPEPPVYRSGPAAPFAASVPKPTALKPSRPVAPKPKT